MLISRRVDEVEQPTFREVLQEQAKPDVFKTFSYVLSGAGLLYSRDKI